MRWTEICWIFFQFFTFCNGQNFVLSFEDNFDGPAIDTTKWKYEVSAFGGGNWEFQIYSPEEQNSYIENGILNIKPTLTADFFGEDFLYNGELNVTAQWGECTVSDWYGCYRRGQDNVINPIMSAKLMSKFDFKYGKVEIRARMPVGDWIWPALWMLPRDWVYGAWPASGEIDICETRGNTNYYMRRDSLGIQQMGSTLHWGQDWSNNQWERTTDYLTSPTGSYGDDFHNYTMVWNAGGFRFEVDGLTVLDHQTPEEGYFSYGGLTGENPWASGGINAPFDQSFYLILNVAVGGTNGYFPDAGARNRPYSKPWSNSSPRASGDFWSKKAEWYDATWGPTSGMEVDYVKIWTYQ